MAKKSRTLVGFPVHPRQTVSKTHRQEYDNEKRAKELKRKGFNQEAIGGMMEIPEHHVVKMLRHDARGEMHLDGQL